MEKLPKRIKELRKSMNLKQSELADKINVSMYTVSVWERGVRKPEYENLDALCDIFNVNLGYLLGTTDDPTPQADLGDEFLEGSVEDDERGYLQYIFSLMSRLDKDSQQIIAASVNQAYKICKERGTLEAGYKISVEKNE